MYRLLASGVLRQPITKAQLARLPRQRGALRETSIARITAAGFDPARVLWILNCAAANRADCDTLIHAGRFLLAGNAVFLAALFHPPAVEWCGKDYRQAPQLPFPAFIAGRVRLFSQTVPEQDSAATVRRLWGGYWRATLRAAKFDVCPSFQDGQLRFAPEWQNDAAIYCRAMPPVPSFFAPICKATQDERAALKKLSAWFPPSKVWDMYGLDKKTPVILLLVRAMLAARCQDSETALDYVRALGVPSPSTRLPFPQIPDPEWARVPMPQHVAAAYVRHVRRMLGHYRLSVPGGGMRGQALTVEAQVQHVAAALGISRPTLYAWAARAKPAAGRRAQDKALTCQCGEPIAEAAESCPHCGRLV